MRQGGRLFSLSKRARAGARAGAPVPPAPPFTPPPPPPAPPRPGPAAEPFLKPVDWKAWGLEDYPKVVKTPMDLGTVKAKLEKGDYSSAKEFRHDTNLVWTNCMTYNADGSDYYMLASTLKKIFEEKYAKTINEDEEPVDMARPPTLVDKKMACQNIYNINAEDLGKVVQILDQRCEVSGRAGPFFIFASSMRVRRPPPLPDDQPPVA